MHTKDIPRHVGNQRRDAQTPPNTIANSDLLAVPPGLRVTQYFEPSILTIRLSGQVGRRVNLVLGPEVLQRRGQRRKWFKVHWVNGPKFEHHTGVDLCL